MLFHIHIPKTGGNTLQLILKRNLGRKYQWISNEFGDGPFESERIEQYLSRHAHVKCLSSHRLHLDRLPIDEVKEHIAIAFVRDPLDRLYSDYHYSRKVGLDGGPSRFDSFEKFAHDLADRPESGYWNMQAKFLGGVSCTEDLLCSGKLLLFPIEDFKDSLIVIQSEVPELRRLGFVKQNENRLKQRREIAPKLEEFISSQLIDQDLAVYSKAKKFLKQRRASLSVREIARFDSRLERQCLVFNHFHRHLNRVFNRTGRGLQHWFPV